MKAVNEARNIISRGGGPVWPGPDAAAAVVCEQGAIGQQRGGGSLLMVLILLLMGSLLLHATRRQLSDNLSLVAGEGRYYRESAAAASALAWGERLNWPQTAGWHCQRLQPQGWRACLWPGEPHALLRGDGGEGTLALWRWLSGSGGRLQRVAHGWLDFCPLKETGDCHVPDASAEP